MRLINLKNLQNYKTQNKKKKEHRLLKTQLNFLNEDKEFLTVLKAKYFQ